MTEEDHEALARPRRVANRGYLEGLDDIDQRIVRAMVTTGASNKQIAVDLGLNLRAFEKRVQRIAQRLDIKVRRGSRVRPILRRLLLAHE